MGAGLSKLREADLILDLAAAASSAIRFEDLGLNPVALNLGFFTLKWYSLAYLAGILIGYWYLLKLVAQPGSPMARRHADDMIFYATLGIVKHMMPSDTWQLIFSVIGAIAVGVTAFLRVAGMAATGTADETVARV